MNTWMDCESFTIPVDSNVNHNIAVIHIIQLKLRSKEATAHKEAISWQCTATSASWSQQHANQHATGHEGLCRPAGGPNNGCNSSPEELLMRAGVHGGFSNVASSSRVLSQRPEVERLSSRRQPLQ